jgi:hypothetical protein
MYANSLTGQNGNFFWYPNTASSQPGLKNKYILSVDNDGHLQLASNLPPYSDKFDAYVNTASSGSLWLQFATKASVDSSISGGSPFSRIKACVDSVTGELHLAAAGRTQILYCGVQLWLSNNMGADRGACTQMFPLIVPEPA